MEKRANQTRVRAVITDWAGTIVDYGSLAPITAVMETFRLQGVPITPEEARQPMGRAKRDHLATLTAMPRIAQLWRSVHGTEPTESDVDRMYHAFLPLQKQVLGSLSHVIPGVQQALSLLRTRGLKIGSTTGYTRELMTIVTAVAHDEGLDIDTVMTADDVPSGRPAPWLIFRAAEQLGVFPMSAVVAIDDTPVGIEAGRNAGAWTVAVARTGNALGLSESDARSLSGEEWSRRRRAIDEMFREAGAHFVIDSFAELPTVIPQIERRNTVSL